MYGKDTLVLQVSIVYWGVNAGFNSHPEVDRKIKSGDYTKLSICKNHLIL